MPRDSFELDAVTRQDIRTMKGNIHFYYQERAELLTVLLKEEYTLATFREALRILEEHCPDQMQELEKRGKTIKDIELSLMRARRQCEVLEGRIEFLQESMTLILAKRFGFDPFEEQWNIDEEKGIIYRQRAETLRSDP